MTRKHNHYFKNVEHLQTVDVYRVLDLFEVTDQALGHAVKKLLVAGGRGAKDWRKDVQEAIDTLQRRLEMADEDACIEKAEPALDPSGTHQQPKPYCGCNSWCRAPGGQALGVECRKLPGPVGVAHGS